MRLRRAVRQEIGRGRTPRLATAPLTRDSNTMTRSSLDEPSLLLPTFGAAALNRTSHPRRRSSFFGAEYHPPVLNTILVDPASSNTTSITRTSFLCNGIGSGPASGAQPDSCPSSVPTLAQLSVHRSAILPSFSYPPIRPQSGRRTAYVPRLSQRSSHLRRVAGHMAGMVK